MAFFGYNRPGSKISEGVREQFVHQSMMAGIPASYFGIAAWPETDLTEDLKKIDVPTLMVHGDDDQIVPFANSAERSSKIIPKAILKVYEGGSHGIPTTHKDRLNQNLLAFHPELNGFFRTWSAHALKHRACRVCRPRPPFRHRKD